MKNCLYHTFSYSGGILPEDVLTTAWDEYEAAYDLFGWRVAEDALDSVYDECVMRLTGCPGLV